MKVACKADGSLVYCHQQNQLEENENYFCPHCHQTVILRKTKHGVCYFVHQLKKQSTGETSAHQNGKLALFLWCSPYCQADIESYIEHTKQRADVLVTLKQAQIALEYQCSKISIEELKSRNQLYATQQIIPCWIFGKRFLKMKRLNDLLKEAMRYHPKLGNYLLFLVDEQLILHTHIQQKNQNSEYTYATQQYTLSTVQPISFLKGILQSSKARVYRSKKSTRSITPKEILLHTSVENRLFLAFLYQRQLNVEQLPTTCLSYPKYSTSFKTPNYIWKGYLYALQVEKETAVEVMNELIENKYVRARDGWQEEVCCFMEEISR